MIRFLFKLVLCLLLALGTGWVVLAVKSGDPAYTLYEWVSPARFRHYDNLIRSVATEHQLDPMLVKSVVWQESRFDPLKYGSAGERGLMQVSEGAAAEWARENKVENFRVEDLFDAKTNLSAGTWYLHRAIEHWQSQADPLPFALAEYNAGASRSQRWAGGNGTSTPMSARDFINNIDFPGTRKYVDSVMERYQFYQKRGGM